MPVARGNTRRPRLGRGSTRSTSVSFAANDLIWIEEIAAARNVSVSLVIGEAIVLYRAEMDAQIEAITLREKQDARPKLPGAPAEKECVEL